MDPRPLVGEPLSLDLLNTQWVDGGLSEDLLETVSGLAIWLDTSGLAHRAEADLATLEATRAARDALRAVVTDPGDPGAVARLNEVLARGRVRRELGARGPSDTAEVADPAWLPAWLAADDYLRLRGEVPTRIKKCAGCVLHFYDTSQNGTRRWCSMAVCGNRAKAARHYTRTRKSTARRS